MIVIFTSQNEFSKTRFEMIRIEKNEEKVDIRSILCQFYQVKELVVVTFRFSRMKEKCMEEAKKKKDRDNEVILLYREKVF